MHRLLQTFVWFQMRLNSQFFPLLCRLVKLSFPGNTIYSCLHTINSLLNLTMFVIGSDV